MAVHVSVTLLSFVDDVTDGIGFSENINKRFFQLYDETERFYEERTETYSVA